MLSKHNGLIMQYNVNSNGIPVSIHIKDETKQVSINHNLIQLEQVPDEFYRLQIVDSQGEKMYEVMDTSDIKDELAYKVDYPHGIVYFHPNKGGEQVSITYYGRGLQLIHSSRILVDDNTMLSELIHEVGEIKSRGAIPVAIKNDEVNRLAMELKMVKEQVSLLQKQNMLLVEAIAKLERGDE